MTSPESKAQIMNAYDFAKQLPPDSDKKTVIPPDNARHGEVDQRILPRYKDANRNSPKNESKKPSSPKPKEGSKSPSHSEATKKSKCVSMKGVSIDDPRPAFKRYKLVL
ncbi:hypothetical protein GE21DRAFT_1270350 [Neurospora crassa]|uniref:Uncharacterized protein n=2 Tax=Neurospora crassa TaxID=5141 RepID=Q1K592_NEUCR|nr:hypothetical protein NCU05150 [Neurospora crassa OR74A]EAA27412.1 hypothetical protein NCU05150 [Neurospora crassa OR74A]KHE88019.1 hypothetical protein GE21DRAFT_1270350 [Neurospora crassa]CAD70555.1 hypothetical protein [Neurospora crassa]|eukprot:XP_956648.1 hypothetical protein NCU05150 [Neurospora crassa OR74A]